MLIVDDHPTFRATARMLLEAEGYDVIGEAPDGMSGITQAGALHPDLVLLDVNLPDIDGFDVAARIRRRAHLQPRSVGLRSAGAAQRCPWLHRQGRPVRRRDRQPLVTRHGMI